MLSSANGQVLCEDLYMRVMVALDGSQYSQAALSALISRRWPSDTIIQIVTVIHDTNGDQLRRPDLAYDHNVRPKLEHASDILNSASQAILPMQSNVSIDFQILVGNVKEALLDHAAEWHADLIIVGSRGSMPPGQQLR